MKTINRLAFISMMAVSFGVHSTIAIGAPQPKVVSGVFANGAVAEVAGSGFGAKTRPGPMLWDTVDNQSVYSTLADGQAVPAGASYVWSGNTASPAIVIQRGVGRTSSSAAHYRNGNGGQGFIEAPVAGGGLTPDKVIRRLYVSWWVKFSVPPFELFNNGSHKFIRVWDGNTDNLRISWTQMHMTVANNLAGGASSLVTWGKDMWTAGTGPWYHHEFYVDTVTGVIEARVNGKVAHHLESADPRYLLADHPNGLRVGLIGWDSNNGSVEVANLTLQMDDIWIDSTPARVILADSADLNVSTIQELQPAVSWNDARIQFNVNVGQLDPRKPMYLFVVDDTGVASSVGVPVSTKSMPSPPKDVTVN